MSYITIDYYRIYSTTFIYNYLIKKIIRQYTPFPFLYLQNNNLKIMTIHLKCFSTEFNISSKSSLVNRK